jgi:hypothetical protein
MLFLIEPSINKNRNPTIVFDALRPAPLSGASAPYIAAEQRRVI